MDDSVMLLWVKYLKELELACAAQPRGGAAVVKTMCKAFCLHTLICVYNAYFRSKFDYKYFFD